MSDLNYITEEGRLNIRVGAVIQKGGKEQSIRSFLKGTYCTRLLKRIERGEDAGLPFDFSPETVYISKKIV